MSDRNPDRATNEKSRRYIADVITSALAEEGSDVHVVEVQYENVGPMGGVSATLYGYVDQDEDTIASFIISVYSDDRTEAELDGIIERRDRQRERAARIRRLTDIDNE